MPPPFISGHLHAQKKKEFFIREDAATLREQERQLARRLKLLIWALALTAVPLVIALAVLPGKIQASLTSLGEARLTQVAEDLAIFTEKTMELHLETVRSLSTTPALRNALLRHNEGKLAPQDVDQVNQILLGVVKEMSTELQGMFLCSKDGFSFAGALQSGDRTPYAHLDVRDRAYFTEAAKTLRPQVSDPMYSKVSSMPVVVLVAPILDEHGAFAGVLGMSIRTRYLSDLIATKKIGKTGYPFAIDRQGLLVAHPDPKRFFSDALIKLARAETMVARMRNGEHGIESYISSQGTQKIAAFAPAPICGWSIGASIEIAEFEEPVRQMRIVLTVLLAACLLIGFVIAGTIHVGLKRLNLALAEAQASEQRFKLFANIAGCAVWDWQLSDNEFWWNEGLTTTFGWEPRQITSLVDFLVRLPESERDPVKTGLRHCRERGSWMGEHSFQRADGTLSYIIHRAATIRDANGTAVRIIGSMTDISDRRRNEQKIVEQAALLNKTRDSIIMQGLDHAIRFWNAGARQLYGWTQEEALGKRHDEFLSVDATQYAEATKAVLRDGNWVGRLRKVSKTGQSLIVECRWTLLVDENKHPYAVLSIGTDITERLLMEEKFLRAQRLESIGTLAGGIAHDLNNLLSPILAGTGLLRLDKLNKDQEETVDIIEQSAKRGANLVKQVLAFARGVQGSLVSVHIGYVLREVESILRSTFPKSITLRSEVGKDLQLIQADPTQLTQILINLCVNARDAMPQGGILSMSARNMEVDSAFAATNCDLNPGPYVRIDVCDTGIGIPDDLKTKIFEPFFTTKGPGKGTGLGLSTVLGIVKGLGGAINVYSEMGRGTVFRIYLPASLRNDEPSKQTAAPSLAESRGQGLILLADDEALVLNVARRVLEARGYSVLAAKDGVRALQLYQDHRREIALLVTDIMMPHMDGLTLIKAVRQSDPALPIIAMSGLNDSNQLEALADGVTCFLNKPFTVASLLEATREALQKDRDAGETTAPTPKERLPE